MLIPELTLGHFYPDLTVFSAAAAEVSAGAGIVTQTRSPLQRVVAFITLQLPVAGKQLVGRPPNWPKGVQAVKTRHLVRLLLRETLVGRLAEEEGVVVGLVVLAAVRAVTAARALPASRLGNGGTHARSNH
jgi:hypothetical protein